MFDTYLRLWDLVPDGGPILTASGGVLPVVWHARPAMLKVATCDEERRGNALMTWWNGDGAARVWLHDSDAVLLERAQPAPTLNRPVRRGPRRRYDPDRMPRGRAAACASRTGNARGRAADRLVPRAAVARHGR
jgi:hypothetical protein